MSRRITGSLSAQLFCGVLLSLLAAAAAFVPCFLLGDYILSHTVYGKPFMDRMADQQFGKLQTYVEQESITVKNLHRLNAWCGRGNQVYLTIYMDDAVLYDRSASAEDTLDPEEYSPAWENPEREYDLILSDGAAVQAFLYYYTGDVYYYWSLVFSGLIAFVVFSLCFIAFVHRKLRYVKRLKAELDILAGGDLDYPVTVEGEDELGELASGIDQMRRSILAHQDTEAQMRSASSQLVTAVSHDLRTPLTSLLAYLELMDRGKYDSEEQLHYFIGQSLGKTCQLKDMADKLFEYFLVYSSEWEPAELETMDADQVFQQFWGEYAFSLENQGFHVHTDFNTLGGNLRINLNLLRRAFDNLYSNLLKYADPSRPIELAYIRDSDQVRLTLVNHTASRRNQRESTNIGLNTCQRVLQYHGGTFSAREQDGRFRVTVTLPVAV